MEPIKVGIVGFGRSGCGIHASAIKDMRDMFDVVAIADFIPERRSHEAFPNAKPYASAEALIADPNVEMVIVSTFNSMHAPVAPYGAKGRETRSLRKAVWFHDGGRRFDDRGSEGSWQSLAAVPAASFRRGFPESPLHHPFWYSWQNLLHPDLL